MSSKLFNTTILVFALTISFIFYAGFGARSKVFYGDALGYYLYLPATFIYNNLKTPGELPHDKGIPDDVFWYLGHVDYPKAANGTVVIQYTYGVALMESPFFLIAHAWEKLTGRTASGYSATYSNLLKISAMFYALLGLMLVYSVLRTYFTGRTSLVTTAGIFLGTNLFWFSVYQAGMSHVPVFFLYALLIYLTVRVNAAPRRALFIAIGLTAGMITIIRPSDVLCLLIPLLYGVCSKETAREKIGFIRQHGSGVGLMVIAFIVPIIPQLVYWKLLTGDYFFYSYGSQSFDWLHPHIIEGLFYFSNGWLPYSPMMIFAVAGMFFFKPLRKWALATWIVFALYVYVIYSWYCYNYLNGLGSRPMIHLYPLLALPFAAVVAFIGKQRTLVKAAFRVLFLFFIAVNISYSMQEARGILVSPVSNIKFNLQMLFRMHLRYNDLVVKDTWAWQPDTADIRKTGTLGCENYGDSTSEHYVKDTLFGGRFVYKMQREDHHQSVSVVYDKKLFENARWFKCSGMFMYPQPPGYYKHLLVISSGNKLWRACTIENKIDYWDKNTDRDELRLDHFKTGEWGYVYYFVKIPKNLQKGDSIKLSIDNTDRLELYLSNVCLELYK